MPTDRNAVAVFKETAKGRLRLHPHEAYEGELKERADRAITKTAVNGKTRAEIEGLCSNIEKEHKVRMLFAVENGSRAWRMESENSDYDVRFVFVRPLEDYLSISPPEQVINFMAGEVDASGFDIFKFARLLSDSNPTVIEWLMSDIVYYGRQDRALKNFAEKNFSKATLYHHYRSLCVNNYTKYVQSGKDVTDKRYLYTFRGLVNAKWVLGKGTIPPIAFTDALEGMEGTMPEGILEKIRNIVALKKLGREKEKRERVSVLDEYVEGFINSSESPPAERATQAQKEELGKELRKIVLGRT